MDNLPNEISQTIILKLNREDLCHIIFCNKRWFQILSDQYIWKRLLTDHFGAHSLINLTACQSYQFYHYWPRRVEWIFHECKKEDGFRSIFSWGSDRYFRKAISMVGPQNYNNIEIIWPQISKYCFLGNHHKSTIENWLQK